MHKYGTTDMATRLFDQRLIEMHSLQVNLYLQPCARSQNARGYVRIHRLMVPRDYATDVSSTVTYLKTDIIRRLRTWRKLDSKKRIKLQINSSYISCKISSSVISYIFSKTIIDTAGIGNGTERIYISSEKEGTPPFT